MNTEYKRIKQLIDSLASTLRAGEWRGSGMEAVEIAQAINKAESEGKLSQEEKVDLTDYCMRQIDMAVGKNPEDSSLYHLD